ncbi:ferritin heavy chain-like [Heptranchias perlo]|uniref:ferritin heavy chain-like n=1 Tax=Heptranchias perlo TaxID=212740 RepID=UPI00355960E5
MGLALGLSKVAIYRSRLDPAHGGAVTPTVCLSSAAFLAPRWPWRGSTRCLPSYYFDRDDVALRHFVKFFKEQSQEKHEDAEKLLKFQNHLGGYPVNWLRLPFQKPEQDEWSNGLEVMQRALQMEKDVNQSLLDLHKLSTERTDPHTHYLDEQVKMIKKLGDHITNLKRLGAPENGMGVYLFDKHTLGESD